MWTGNLSDLSAGLTRGLDQLGELAAGAVETAARVKADVEATLDAGLRQAAGETGVLVCECVCVCGYAGGWSGRGERQLQGGRGIAHPTVVDPPAHPHHRTPHPPHSLHRCRALDRCRT